MFRTKPFAMMSAAASRSVSEYLTAPSKIVQTLDWKKHSASVLNVMISKEKIDLAVALHPACHEYEADEATSPLIRMIRPILLSTRITDDNRRVLDANVPKSFLSAINDYNVCGIIVGWPVEREGWCGASCGRVLNTLDQLVQNSDVANSRLFANNRPIALYDMDHHISDEDEWGRSPTYTETCHDQVHVCSEEQSYIDFVASHNTDAPLIALWDDFCRTYWPHLLQQQHSKHQGVNVDHSSDDCYSSLFG